jgi:hypothetical protein
MNLFEFYELAKDTLIKERLHQVANFLAEQNDTTSVVTRKYDMIKVNYENSPYFERNKQFWRDIETPLDRITPKEFTLNPLKSDEDFMENLKFEYDNHFNTEGNRIKKYFGDSPYHAISGKGKSIATFDDCETLGDCQKKIKTLGRIKPEYSLNDIEQAIAYNINAVEDSFKAQERIKKWFVDAEQILPNTENIKTQGEKND